MIVELASNSSMTMLTVLLQPRATCGTRATSISIRLSLRLDERSGKPIRLGAEGRNWAAGRQHSWAPPPRG